MLESLKPYEQMKPSGLPWLGDVPAHWAVNRLNAMGTFGKGKGGSKRDDADHGVACVRYGEIYTTYADRIVAVKTRIAEAQSIAYSPIQRGDVLLTASGEDLEEIGKAAVYLSDERAVCGGDLVILRPSEHLDPLFLAFALNSHASVWQKAQMGRGTTVKHIYPTQLRSLACAVPPIKEQRSIARFTSNLHSRIDRATLAKRKTIGLLNEQKQAIVHQAVTRGLDPSVPLKPSGLPWLEQIPVGWKVLRAKSVFDAIDERSAAGVEELLTVSSAKGIVPRSSSSVTMFKASSYIGHKLCSPGDLVVNSLWAWAGGLGVSGHRGIVSTAYSVYRPKPQFACYAEYLHELLRSLAYKWEFTVRSKGIWVSRLQLSDESFMAMPVLLPPRDEQQTIVDFMEKELRQNDLATSKLEREVGLLTEYRTRLTSDVVTGKLDVRKAAKSLPELDEAPPESVDALISDVEDELELAESR